MDAVQGSPVRVVASVVATENNQVVDMKWTRPDGKPMPPGVKIRRQGHNLTLEIDKAGPEHAGEYAVTVVNRVTAVTRTIKVNVIGE